jgi:hypothetical protein
MATCPDTVPFLTPLQLGLDVQGATGAVGDALRNAPHQGPREYKLYKPFNLYLTSLHSSSGIKAGPITAEP